VSRLKLDRANNRWIDACMRQLKYEGWIHHLARHSVACFITRGQCYISWERGMEVFDGESPLRKTLIVEWLIDWDPASNVRSILLTKLTSSQATGCGCLVQRSFLNIVGSGSLSLLICSQGLRSRFLATTDGQVRRASSEILSRVEGFPRQGKL